MASEPNVLVRPARLVVRPRIVLVSLSALVLAAARDAAGQSVLLQIRPQIGDTLRIRFEQETQLTGTKTSGNRPTTASSTTTLRMLSRAIVEGATSAATIVRTITDSVELSTSDARARGLGEQTEQMLRGRSMRLRIAPDGTMALASDGDQAGEASQVVSMMPAALPKDPVAVGDSWTREMPLPGSAPASTGPAGWLHARFHLDSLSRNGAVAYVSMHGEMQAEPAATGSVGPVLEKGSVNGTMFVDRRRGWLTDSRFTIVAHSVVAPSGAPAAMRFTTRITQRMHTEERR